MQITIRPGLQKDIRRSASLLVLARYGLPDHAWGQTSTRMAVADCDGEVVGLTMGRRIDDRPALRQHTQPEHYTRLYELEALAGGTWFLQEFAVHPQHAETGVDELLLADADRRARESQAWVLSAIVGWLQPDPLPRYNRHGFEVRAERNGLFANDNPVKWLLLVRETLH